MSERLRIQPRISSWSAPPARHCEPSLARPAPGGAAEALDTRTRRVMEAHLGHDFRRVRIHADRRAAASAEASGARAYTLGHDIVFGPGAYAVGTSEGARLLAHELTHVVQQSRSSGAPGTSRQAEDEAARNGRRLGEGRDGATRLSVPAGLMQREEKPKATASGERSGTKEGKDKFSFKADVTVPLPAGLSFGAVSFLDDLKLSGSGGVSSEVGLGTGPASLDELKLQFALTLAKLELANVKEKADALRQGKLSFGSTLSASGGPTFTFDPLDTKGSLGASLENKLSATTSSLIPSGAGTLTLGTSLSGTAALTQELGTESKLSPKAESKAAVSADYASKPLPGLGGYSVTAGLTGSASSAIAPTKVSNKLSGGASVGTSGKALGAEHFVKIQVSGDVSVDYAAGTAATTTKSVFIGASTGFKF